MPSSIAARLCSVATLTVSSASGRVIGDGPLDEADNLLAQTGLGALDTFPDDADELAGDAGAVADSELIPPVVEDALALVWRSLAMWVALIGGVSLVAALA